VDKTATQPSAASRTIVVHDYFQKHSLGDVTTDSAAASGRNGRGVHVYRFAADDEDNTNLVGGVVA